MRRWFLAVAFVICASPALAQTCTDGTATYPAGKTLVKQRRPSTTASTISTLSAHGWVLDHTDLTTDGGLDYNSLVFRCPVPPPPPPPPPTPVVVAPPPPVVTAPPPVVSPAPVVTPPPVVVEDQQPPRVYRTWPLQSQAEIDSVSQFKGGNRFVTYDDAVKAAKVTITQWRDLPTTLAASLGADDTSLTLSAASAQMLVGYALRLDDEVVTVRSTSTQSVTVPIVRGAYKTARAAHPKGTTLWVGYNSLPNQLWLPLNLTTTESVLVQWDHRWAPEWASSISGLKHYKAFNIDDRSVWTEPGVFFASASGVTVPPGAIGVGMVRSYSALLPPVTNVDLVTPRLANPPIAPNRWTRTWVYYEPEQAVTVAGVSYRVRLVTVWQADEQTDPVKLIDRLPWAIRSKAGEPDFARIRVEMNTSTDRFGPTASGQIRPELTAWVRDVVVRVGVSDLAPVLVRPIR